MLGVLAWDDQREAPLGRTYYRRWIGATCGRWKLQDAAVATRQDSSVALSSARCRAGRRREVRRYAGTVSRRMVRRNLAERGEIGDDETVVMYITGDGLKTIDAVEPTVETVAIEPDVDAVDAALERRVTV